MREEVEKEAKKAQERKRGRQFNPKRLSRSSPPTGGPPTGGAEEKRQEERARGRGPLLSAGCGLEGNIARRGGGTDAGFNPRHSRERRGARPGA